jgi:hypothetical protein
MTNGCAPLGFPHYRRSWFREVPDGWTNLGPVSDKPAILDGKAVYNFLICTVCQDRVYVGRENDETFYFCARCLKKLQ